MTGRALAVLALLAAPSLFAQQVEIDAVVTDRRGNTISDLKAEDFELLENGRPQAIANFTALRDDVDRQPRNLVILIDALALRGRVRRALYADLAALIEKTMNDGDLAQLFSWHDTRGLEVLTAKTQTRAEIVSALAKAEATLVADREERIDSDGAARAQRDLALMRRKAAAIQRVVDGIHEPERRNVMIYVSGSFPKNAGAKIVAGMHATRVDASGREDFDTSPMIEAIARTANSRGVVLYALRPDLSSVAPRAKAWSTGLTSTVDPAFGGVSVDLNTQEVSLEPALAQNDAQALDALTTATGGTLALGTSAIHDAVERIPRDLGTYYKLAFASAGDADDRERRIEVKPRNRNYVVRARNSVLERSEASRAHDLLVARVFESGAEGQLDFDVQAGASHDGVIPIEVTIPVEQLHFEPRQEQLVARFSVLIVSGRDIGHAARLVDETKEIAVPKEEKPAGAVRRQFEVRAAGDLTVAVLDEQSGLAGTDTIAVAVTNAPTNVAIANDAWQAALQRANAEHKLVLVYFHPKICRACTRFENETLTHPAIRRRLSDVVFTKLSSTAGDLAKAWNTREAGLGVFDRKGTFRLAYDGVPDLAMLGVMLDDIVDITPHIERAVSSPDDVDLESAIALMMLGRRTEAREALERAIANGTPETRQYAIVARALLDTQERRGADALKMLDSVIASARTPQIAGEAWLAIGLVHRFARANDEASRAFAQARDLLGNTESRLAVTSDEALAALENAADGSGPIRIVPPEAQVVSGRVRVNTIVTSAEVASVAFLLDGAQIERVRRPPFIAKIDFGRIPEERTLSVIAFDSLGNEAGRDELTINGGGERFWFRIAEPSEGAASGATHVRLKLRAPSGQTVERVTIAWNDEVRAIVVAPPWETSVAIPNELGVLRGVATLADGRTAEDAVLLNASGHSERADVPLVELPVTLGDPRASLDAGALSIREGGTPLVAESVQPPTESPLTAGFVFDTSASMQDALVNVQEAALGFIDGVLGERDRGFIVSFSTRARLVQPPTTDKTRLRAKVMALRARGSTALYDAIAVGLLQLQGVKGRRALIVFTDGADLTSHYNAAEIAALAKRTHVPIHLIATTPNRASRKLGGPRPDELRWGASYRGLSSMAESTGGRAYVLNRLDDLPDVYRRIGDAMRSQFLVFVRASPGRHENDWRVIRVEARGVSLFAPEGYYAPW